MRNIHERKSKAKLTSCTSVIEKVQLQDNIAGRIEPEPIIISIMYHNSQDVLLGVQNFCTSLRSSERAPRLCLSYYDVSSLLPDQNLLNT